MPGSSSRDSSHHSAGLLLRVYRPGGQHEEVYLAPGLTIGRTVANSVVLEDDSAVDRTHARVEVGDDGKARLRCIEQDSTLDVGGLLVRELSLEVGSQFQIGETRFECISGRRGPDRPNRSPQPSCPCCGATGVSTEGEGTRQCPACNDPILPVRLDPHDAVPILVPALYGTYRAERYIARGGMGLVLKGSHEDSKDPVAIKVLLPGQITDRSDSDRFEREVMMMTRVRHPSVVKLLNHGQSGRFHYLVLEWIEGPTLRQEIADSNLAAKPASFDIVFRWFEQVCNGLAAIHAVGMIHRDIKPSNILIGPAGVARIADFGIAKRIDAGSTSYTTTGYAPGTFEYMAPEQLSAPDSVDVRADLYALGVTFYESLTGARPVGAWEPAAVLNRSVPRAFDKILVRLLASRREQRYGDIHELCSAVSGLKWNRELKASTFIGAGNGVIWLFTFCGILTGVIGIPLACLIAIASQDARVFFWIIYLIAFWAIVGTIVGGVGGAIFGVRVAEDGNPSKIKPIGFREALTRIFAEIQSLWRTFDMSRRNARARITTSQQWRVQTTFPQKTPHAPSKDNVASEPKKNDWLKAVGWVIAGAILRYFDHTVFKSYNNYILTRFHTASLKTPEVPISNTPSNPTAPPLVPPRNSADPSSYINSVGMRLILMPTGEFLMGSFLDKDAEGDEKPQHRVRITRPFYLGATEVTHNQYRAVTGQSLSYFNGSEDLPVEKVSWNDALAFCNKLSEREGLKPYYQFGVGAQSGGDGYRLPTEAEWEYACRAGSTTRYSFGNDAASLGEYAWYDGNSGNKTHAVGQKRPNAFGLYDMQGNVCEWCWDGYDAKYYDQSPVDDPRGPSWASVRVIRGGGWNFNPLFTRSAYRHKGTPEARDYDLGFRLARVQSGR